MRFNPAHPTWLDLNKLSPSLHFSSLARATMASTSVPGDPSATPDTPFLLLVPSVLYILRFLCIWYTQSADSSFSSNLQVSRILSSIHPSKEFALLPLPVTTCTFSFTLSYGFPRACFVFAYFKSALALGHRSYFSYSLLFLEQIVWGEEAMCVCVWGGIKEEESELSYKNPWNLERNVIIVPFRKPSYPQTSNVIVRLGC